ncbi:MAG: hypothetical protein DRJ26_04535 [Candidatus Methanomethylicota archaeon]|uniref:Uncharacterized protein n=1 Tax=Thermoproteota archaeon TaxID=2056631 RepID=A0A497EZV6_9CREN|nr:MAG: hypothetical protein DRJ26_04535 [Candidatus Verstraetearchaeota archaeon]
MVSETRWYRNEQDTVNGLTTYLLALSKITNGTYATVRTTSPFLPEGTSIGIRVWVRHSDGTETEVTDGSPVAVSTLPMGSSITTTSSTWDCPQTSLAETDSIVVRVYGNVPTWKLIEEFTTEVLNAVSLDSATWTVYYTWSTPWSYNWLTGRYTWGINFYWDGDYESRIENFSWSAAVVAPLRIIIGDSIASIIK